MLQAQNCGGLNRLYEQCRRKPYATRDDVVLRKLHDYLVICHVRRGQCESAATVANQHMEVFPNTSGWSRNHLAWVGLCYEWQGRYSHSLRHTEPALRVLSDHARGLGTCLWNGYFDLFPDNYDVDSRAFFTALCSAARSYLKLGQLDDFKAVTTKTYADPNYRLMLHEYHWHRLEDIVKADFQLRRYLEEGACLSGRAAQGTHRRWALRNVCRPAIDYLVTIGVCEAAAAMYDNLPPGKEKEADRKMANAITSCYLRMGNYDEAEYWTQRLQEMGGGSTGIPGYRISIALHRGRVEEAISLAEGWVEKAMEDTLATPNAHAKRSDEARAFIMLGLVNHAAGLPTVADRHFRAGEALLRQLVQDHPNQAEYKKLWAQSLFNSGAPLESADLLAELTAIYPETAYADLVESKALLGAHGELAQIGRTALRYSQYRRPLRVVLLAYLSIGGMLGGDNLAAEAFASRAAEEARELGGIGLTWDFSGAVRWLDQIQHPQAENVRSVIVALERWALGGEAAEAALALAEFAVLAATLRSTAAVKAKSLTRTPPSSLTGEKAEKRRAGAKPVLDRVFGELHELGSIDSWKTEAVAGIGSRHLTEIDRILEEAPDDPLGYFGRGVCLALRVTPPPGDDISLMNAPLASFDMAIALDPRPQFYLVRGAFRKSWFDTSQIDLRSGDAFVSLGPSPWAAEADEDLRKAVELSGGGLQQLVDSVNDQYQSFATLALPAAHMRSAGRYWFVAEIFYAALAGLDADVLGAVVGGDSVRQTLGNTAYRKGCLGK